MLEALCIAEGVGMLLLLVHNMYLKHKIKRIIERYTGKVRERYLKAHKGFLDHYVCAYCFKPVHRSKMQVEHIYPYNRGGSNKNINLVAACQPCNSKKSDKAGMWVVRGYVGKLLTENVIAIGIFILVLIVYIIVV